MTPDEARQMYRDQLTLHGEDISIRRYDGIGTGRTYVDRPVRARVTGYSPQEMVGGITQGDRKVILMAEDLAGESPAFTVAKSDKVVAARFGSAELAILGVDDNTRRVDGELIAYELHVRG